jgi:hypothetical protein
MYKERRSKKRQHGKISGTEAGVSLVETMVSAAIMLVGIIGIMSVFTFAVGQSKGQGDISTRTVAYTQDKMEQLMSLFFTDGATDTTSASNPMPTVGGTGLGGNSAPGSTLGGTDPANPVAGYVDYVDWSGNRQQAPTANTFFTRVWSITTDATGHLKTVKVVTKANTAAGASGASPITTLTSMKSDAQ